MKNYTEFKGGLDFNGGGTAVAEIGAHAGGAFLVEAADQVLNNDRVHVAIVRDVVGQELYQDLAFAQGADRTAMLHEAIPELGQLDEFVSQWWRSKGYPDYAISPRIQSSTVIGRNTATKTHIDQMQPFNKAYCYMGALSISLGDGVEPRSRAEYFSRKLKPQQCTSPDGSFMPAKYEKLLKRVSLFGSFVRFESQTTQRTGDAVIIPQLPRPAAHKVLSFYGRSARLLDYPIHVRPT